MEEGEEERATAVPKREGKAFGGRLPVCHDSLRGAPAYTSVRK